jgi:hypothetical protein
MPFEWAFRLLVVSSMFGEKGKTTAQQNVPAERVLRF